MINEIKYKNATLVNADSLVYMKTLQDNCIDLILTDPPYFRVKNEQWDNQWDNEKSYLSWLDDCFSEFYRLLKPSGSLYVFCSSKLASDTEILMRHKFKILNNIVWEKPKGTWLRQHKESLRSFFPCSERILFAEHYDNCSFVEKQNEYNLNCDRLKGQVFTSLIDYFRSARKSLNVSASEINKATGTQMCSHWFSRSQWQLPNKLQYKALQELFSEKAEAKAKADCKVLEKSHSDLVAQYDVLKRDYDLLTLEFDSLKEQYENLRRPFHVTSDVPYTDVWHYNPVPYYKGKHPCEKPSDMISDIIKASSKPGQTVADFFMGSGVTIKQSILLDRKSLGVELETERFNQTLKEINLC